ncbi:MAG: hypothetical protein EOP07_19600 [Proteobacteria bacterium]|nr:MAG: hypothetical protein EOP07_19600 [Pseudomonadota bacterium]
MIRIIILSLAVAAASCSKAPERLNSAKSQQTGKDANGKTPVNPNNGGSGGTTVDPLEADPSAKELKLIEVLQEPADFTFGHIKFSSGKTEAALKIERYAHISPKSSPTESAKQALINLCSDVDVKSASNGDIDLSWRAYTTVETENELFTLTAKGVVLRCIVSIDDQQIALEVLPSDEKLIFGSKVIAQTTAAALMPLKIVASEVYPKTELLEIVKKAIFVEGASVLKDAAFKAVAPATLVECNSFKNDTTVDLIEPGLKILQEFSFIKENSKLGLVAGKAIAGRTQPSCAKVLLKPELNSVKLEMTCADYQSIVQDGLEAGCEWQANISNVLDPGQSIAASFSMAKINYKTVTAASNAEKIRLTPKYPDNQIRSKKILMVNSTPTFVEAASTALDMWIGSSPELYYADFHNYMKTINYSTSGDCAGDLAGGGGYAYLNSTAFTWCGGGDLLDANLKNDKISPFTNLFQIVILSHETRHARGWEHDHDDKSYAPCEGSAKSQVVLHDIATKCTLPFCKPMKKNAIDLYISDMKYNLPGDSRRNQGQCAVWNKALGLTDSSFN